MNDTLLTVEDVATLLHVSPTWVYKRVRRHAVNRLPHLKLGKYVRFRRQDVAHYLETLEVASCPPRRL